MITTSIPAEQRTVLHNVSWETFEALLRDTGEDRGSRFAYDCGTLEIMTPLFEHENPKSNFGNFIVALAEELNIEIRSAGSTTLKRIALGCGRLTKVSDKVELCKVKNSILCLGFY
jgi:Uma2 family endonuclease